MMNENRGSRIREGLYSRIGATRRFTTDLLKDSNWQKLFAVTVFVFALMTALRPKLFFTPQNFTSMMFQVPELGILAVAMAFVIISGGIDLSIVATANISAIVTAFIMTDALRRGVSGPMMSMLVLAVFLLGACIGMICGIFNGYIISRFNIAPMLATLGSMYLYTGIGVLITQGKSISGMPSEMLYMGTGYFLKIPVPMWMLTIVLLIATIILNRTKYGIELRMVGSNSTAAKFSGIRNSRVIMSTYVLSGILAGIIGVEFLSRTNSAKADFGSSYLLQAILCALLGGVHPDGGSGKISGVILALASLQFLASGFNMLRMSAYFKDFVWGLLLLIVMTLHFISNNRSMRKSVPQGGAVKND